MNLLSYYICILVHQKKSIIYSLVNLYPTHPPANQNGQGGSAPSNADQGGVGRVNIYKGTLTRILAVQVPLGLLYGF